ncbi:hypothetical protein AB0939_29810 [Streptomyces sp. NPDC006990]|uniref:hypothetical protein n=1 Tax=Streptomyces sp. NPDC006990 TaxID=3154481 RepID=UPI003454A381
MTYADELQHDDEHQDHAAIEHTSCTPRRVTDASATRHSTSDTRQARVTTRDATRQPVTA